MTKRKLAEVDSMTPEQLAQALRNIPILETWITAIKAHAFETLRNGGKIPGYKLGFGIKHRIWKAGAHADMMKAMAKMGIKTEDMYTQPELLTPPKVEKILKEKGLWPKKPRHGDRPPTPLDLYIDYSMPEPRVMPTTEHDETLDRNSEARKEFT